MLLTYGQGKPNRGSNPIVVLTSMAIPGEIPLPESQRLITTAGSDGYNGSVYDSANGFGKGNSTNIPIAMV